MATSVAAAITYARQKAQTDSNGIGDTNGLAWANNGLIDITRDLIVRGVDAAKTREWYTTLSPSDAQPGRFAWPSDMWALKTIEVDFSGGGGQNYVQASKVDISNLQGDTSWDFLRVNQSSGSPQFTNHGDTGEVFPNPRGTQSVLVRIVGYLQPTEYPDVGTAIGYPQILDFRALGDKILIAYYESLEKWDSAQIWEAKYLKKVTDAINILAPQSKQPIKPEKLRMNGWNY